MLAKFFTKKITILVTIIIWIIFSVTYIINDQWQDFKIDQIQVAYQNGASSSIKTIISESAKCQPIPLFDGSTKVSLIAIECLQQAELEADE